MGSESASPQGAPKKGCIRRGCGCLLGCFGLLVLVAAALVAFALVTKPGPEHRVTSEAPQVPPAGVTLAGPGIILVEMEEGVLEIEPAEPGAAPSASADHDEETSRLETSLDGGSPWQWRVALKPMRTFPSRLLGGKRQEAHLVVRVPRDQRAALIVRFSKGECTLRLGGLALSSVDVEMSLGNCEVRFDEPLAQPLATFRLQGRLGGSKVEGLGNASPASVDLHDRLGEIAVDFGGAWHNGARVDLDFRMGDARLSIPEGIPFFADHVHVSAGNVDGAPMPAAPEGEMPANALRLSVDGRFGSLIVQRPAPAPP
jgi:hypothetical protein